MTALTPRQTMLEPRAVTLLEAADVGGILETARAALDLPALGALVLDRDAGNVSARVANEQGVSAVQDLGQVGFFESQSLSGWFADATPVHLRSDDVPGAHIAAVLREVAEKITLIPAIAGSQVRGFLVAPAGHPADNEQAAATLRIAAAAIAAGTTGSAGSRGLSVSSYAALRNSLAWLQSDTQGNIVSSGGDWGRILGADVDAARISLEHIGSAYGPALAAAISRAIAQRRPAPEIVEVADASGATRVLAVTPRELRDAFGRHIATVVDVADLTEVLGSSQAGELARRLRDVVERLSKHAGFYHSRGTLCRELCRSLVEEAGYPQAWVASIDPATGATSPVAVYGGPRDHVPVLLDRVNTPGPAHDAWMARLSGELPYIGEMDQATSPLAIESAAAGFTHVGIFRMDFERMPSTVLLAYGDDETLFAAEPSRLLTQLCADATLALERLSHLESQRIAQRERDEAYRQLATLINGSPAAIIGFDDHGVITTMNPAAVELAGLSAEQIVGRSLLDLIVVPSRQVLTRLIDLAVRGEMAELQEGPLWIRGGRRRWIRAAAAVLRDGRGEAAGVVVVAMDATREHRLSQRMAKQERQLEKMAAETVVAMDRQRREIAIGLHDSLGQTLAALKLRLRGMAAGDQEALQTSVELVDEAIAQTRSFTFEMYPSTLRELGLQAALEWLTERMQDQHGGTWSFVGRDVDLDEERSAILYRITRELMLNVVKHAHANEVLVMLSRHEGDVSVTVYDNGQGFSDEKASDGQGLGLFSVGVQLDRLGGRLEIDSFSGGSTVRATIPMAARHRGVRE